MKLLTTTLFVCTALAAGPALAQTKPVAKPAAKPATTTTTTKTTVTKPAATAVKPTAKPAAKTTTQTTTTRTATPAPQPAKPAAEPAKKSSSKSSGSASSASGSELFHKGTTMVNLGVGLGLGYGYGYFGTVHSTPALSLSFDHGFKEGLGPGTIGLGGLVGYKGYNYKYAGGTYKSTWNNFLVSVRGTYHYNVLEVPKLDTYAGLSIGVRVQTWKDTFYDNNLTGYASNSTYVTSGIFVGARYFLTDNIGAFTELGYDMNFLKLGLTAKF